MLCLRLPLLVATSLLVSVTASYENVNGKALEKCSGPGMALTGAISFACTHKLRG